MIMPPIIERNLSRICTTVSVVSALVYALSIVDGMAGASRIAALLFSTAATIEIVETGATPRPRGTAMVSMAAFMLIMEGAATWMTQELDKASYIEMCIGGYLLVTLWQMVRDRR